jgi:trk system potassium uptake protein TrkH
LRIQKKRKKFSLTRFSPTRLIVSSFAILIFAGGLLLNLPAASNSGESIGFINALFTATSATCVTGLVVADTLTQWTLFGQIVILVLIQVGGLGIITLATFFSALLGRKMGMKGKILAQASISDYSFTEVVGLIKGIVLITFGVELVGAILLGIRFVPQFGWEGAYKAVFHSISSFCNAGFDLMGNYSSLTAYNGDPIVIFTTGLLIIIGGLGFIVWKDIYDYKEAHWFYLHTKIVLIMTVALLAVGTVFFLFQEYSNPATMGNLPFDQKINAAFFQSVTSRTAGYNSIDIDGMTEVSKMFTIFLMFVGAAPGSTAGGVKVTTLAILIMSIVSNIKGEEQTVILKRRVEQEVVNKSLAIIGLSVILVFSMTTLIISIEGLPFVNVLFECTSAFGTVGLSTGITPGLTEISKILLAFMMFLGRVGPLTFAVAIAMRKKKSLQNSVYPEGKIMVG